MTVTANLYCNVAAWANQSYSVGTCISSGGNAYRCTTAGTTPTAPSGTSTNPISFGSGTSKWAWLSAITFSGATADAVFSAAIAGSVSIGGLSGSITQPIIWDLWYTGATWQTSAAGTAFLNLSGHSFTPTNNLTIQVAPGNSFRDYGSSTPLEFNAVNGISLTLPSSAGGINYFTIGDPNVAFDGIQFKDPLTTSNCTILYITNNNVHFRNCIIDGCSQGGGAVPVDIQPGVTGSLFTNLLTVDRQPANGNLTFIKDGPASATTATFVNCTFVAINGQNGVSAIQTNATGANAWVIRNCVAVGYTTRGVLDYNTVGAALADHCGTDAPQVFSNNGGTNSGGQLVSQTVANMFVSSTTDFRLKSGSPFIDTGVTDTTNIPTADDVFRTSRPQGTSWDMGCYEFSTAPSANPFSATATISTIRAVATATNIANLFSATATISTIRAVATATNLNTAVPPSTWNPSDKDSAITLSSGSTVATTNATTQTGVRTTTSNISGKYYAEFTLMAAASNELTMGIATAAWSFTSSNDLGGNTNSMGITLGDVYTNGTIIGVLLNITAIPGSGQITDGSGNVWTVSVGGQALENGVAPAFSSNVANIYYISGVVYQVNAFNQWYYFTQTSTNVGNWTGTNNLAVPTLGMTSGSVYCMAVDLTARSVWWRLNNGLWNASGTANPDTGVGGFPLTGLLSNALFCAMGDVGTVGDSVLFTGSAPFAYTKPTTFQQWDFIPIVNVAATASIGALQSVVLAQNPVPAAGNSVIGAMSALASFGQAVLCSIAGNISNISAVASGQNPVPVSAVNTIPAITSVITGQIPVAASATITFGFIASVASFTQSNPIAATATIVTTISAVAAGQNPVPASAVGRLGAISCVASFSKSLVATSSSYIPSMTCIISAGNLANATANVTLAISAVGTGFLSNIASMPGAALQLSAAITAAFTNGATAVVRVPTPRAVAAFVQTNPATAIIPPITLRCLATGPNPIIGGGTIQIGAIGTAVIPNGAAGRATLGTLSLTSSGSMYTTASAVNTLTLRAITNVNPSQAVGTIGLQAVIECGTANGVTCAQYIFGLDLLASALMTNMAYTPGAILTLNAYATAGFAISSGYGLANFPIPSASAVFGQNVFATGLTGPSISAAGTFGQEQFTTGEASIEEPVANAVFGQEVFYSARVNVPSLGISATAALLTGIGGRGVIAIGAAATMSSNTFASGLASIPSPGAAIVAGGSALTTALANYGTLSATGNMVFSVLVSASPSLAIGCSVQAGQSNVCVANPTISVPSAVATATNPLAVWAVATLDMTASGTFGQEVLTTAAPWISSVFDYATAGQEALASATVSIGSITCASTALQINYVSATVSLPTLSASGSFLRGWPGNAVVTVPALTASVSAAQSEQVTAAFSIPVIDAVAQFGGETFASAIGTLRFMAAVIVTEENLFSARITIPGSLSISSMFAPSVLAYGTTGIICSGYGTASMQVAWTASAYLTNVSLTGSVYPVPPPAIGEEVVYFDEDDRLIYYEQDTNVQFFSS